MSTRLVSFLTSSTRLGRSVRDRGGRYEIGEVDTRWGRSIRDRGGRSEIYADRAQYEIGEVSTRLGRSVRDWWGEGLMSDR